MRVRAWRILILVAFAVTLLSTVVEAKLVRGTAGRDKLVGTPGADLIKGRGGDDVLRGRAGTDVLRGGRGRDYLRGGRGFDRLVGGAQADVINARDSGRDTILCGQGKGHDVALVDKHEDGIYDCEQVISR